MKAADFSRISVVAPSRICFGCGRRLPLLAFRGLVRVRSVCKGCEWRSSTWPSEVVVQSCVRCGETKTFDQFGRTNKNWRRTCIECESAPATVRSCVVCGIEKQAGQFPSRPNRHGVLYHARKCCDCTSASAKERMARRREDDPAGYKAATAAWRTKNRERYLAMKRAWEATHRRSLGMKERPRRPAVDKEMARFDVKHVRALRHIANRTIPKTGWTAGEVFAWRYKNEGEFREKQKTRTKHAKSKVPLWYANQMLGGTSEYYYPRELLEAKQMQLKINRYMKGNDHEEH